MAAVLKELNYRIWQLRVYLLSSPDRIASWIAYHLPQRIVCFAYLRLHGYATSRPPWDVKHPNECTWLDAVTSWEKNHASK